MTEIITNNYSIHIGNDISLAINRFLKQKKSISKLFIIVDENSLKFCYPALVNDIDLFKEAEIIEIESGEHAKTIEVSTQIWTTLSEYGADRNSMIVSLGGGVITDLGGFVASAFKRGIKFINIPTTLLAQVDASVGGKVGVDHNNIKNEIGFFSNPSAVFVNPLFLETLPKRQLIAGFAEVIKHALITDINYWQFLKSQNVFIDNNWHNIIETSIKIKNDIVTRDFLEQKERKKLNFGHTIAHAIESYTLEQPNQKTLLHGECVAVGMICEAFISHHITKLPFSQLEEISEFILTYFNNISISKMDEERLLQLMKHDKKNNNGDVNFSLLKTIGECEINKKAKPDLIKEALKFYNHQTHAFSSE